MVSNKISSGLLIPFMIWFIINLVSIFDANNSQLTEFFSKLINKIFIFNIFNFSFYIFYTLTISEVFEDYIEDFKIKNAANRLLVLFSILIHIIISYIFN